MQQITLNIDEKYLATFIAFLKTLNYVRVQDTPVISKKEDRKRGFQRIAEDDEMHELASQNMEDFLKITNNYETT